MVMTRESFLKRFSDSRFAWDFFLGPVYNRTIMKAASDFYRDLARGIEAPEGARILDVGSGPGHLALMMAKENPSATVIGVDFAPRQVLFANRMLQNSRIKNCRFVQGDAMALPFAEGSFDIVTSIFSIKYWPDAERGLREIRKVLAPRGLARVAELNRDFTGEEFETLMRMVRSSLAWYYSYHLAHLFARKAILAESVSLDETIAMARSAGFTDVSPTKTGGGVGPMFSMTLRG
jgi:ubiquinone/menaquinone biosynthesis C-methylase UbiE